MRLLLDEPVPSKFKTALLGHVCHTVPEEGLAGRKNGELLSLAEKSGFEVFLTLDLSLEYEQNLRGKSDRRSLSPLAIESPGGLVASQRGDCESFASSGPVNL